MKPENIKIVFPLDVPTLKEAEDLMAEVGNYIDLPKVGLELIHSEGTPSVVAMLREKFNTPVFADVKLNDIPSTVYKAAKALTRHRVSCFNVMASGGRPMMEAAVKGATEAACEMGIERPKVIAVTVLTSLELEHLQEVGILPPTFFRRYTDEKIEQFIAQMNPEEKQVIITEIVMHWAEVSLRAGVDVILSSPMESASIHKKWPRIDLYSPGIRMPYSKKDDQARKLTPGEAVKRNIKYLVIGRPIRNPEGGRTKKQVLQEIRQDIKDALGKET